MLQKVLFAAIAAFTLVISGVAPVVARSHDGLRPVQSNDNRRPAGTTQDGSLVLQLRAAFGGWRPEGEAGPTLRIEALGEEGGPLQVPAPLMRVREGQAIVASVQNDLDAILRVHGWCARWLTVRSSRGASRRSPRGEFSERTRRDVSLLGNNRGAAAIQGSG